MNWLILLLFEALDSKEYEQDRVWYKYVIDIIRATVDK